MPEELKKAFRATIEEMLDADVLLHLVDISDPQMDAHIETVEKILIEMGLADIPRVLVFNKTDLVPTVIVENLSRRLNAVPVSAKNTDTLDGLLRSSRVNSSTKKTGPRRAFPLTPPAPHSFRARRLYPADGTMNQ